MKTENRTFDSMTQAAAALGISKDTLQTFKAAGCPAFRGSRIHEADLNQWAAEHKPIGARTMEQELRRRVEALCWAQAGLVCWIGCDEDRLKAFKQVRDIAAGKLLEAVHEIVTASGWKGDNDGD